MKIRVELLLITLMAAILAPSCSKAEVEPIPERLPFTELTQAPTVEAALRTVPQSGRTLTVALDEPFDPTLNPFADITFSSEFALRQIFTAPLRNDGTPWCGTIETVDNPDGTVTSTVKIRKNMLFSDGEPILIDDYIYGFYVAGDPSFDGSIKYIVDGIVGLDEYISDEPLWHQMRMEAGKKAEELRNHEVIEQDEYGEYLIGTRLEGTFDDRTTAEWETYARDLGYGDAWDRIDQENEDEVLELLALVEMAEHWYDWDPVPWWTDRFFREAMEANGDDTVNHITGITKMDDWTCTVTYRSRDDWSIRKVNRPFIPIHVYGSFSKGDLTDIVTRPVPVGSGPYMVKSISPERVKLVANPLYFEGMPVIGSVEMIHSPGESDLTPSPVPKGTLDEVFSAESLGMALPDGGPWEPVLWKLRLR